jgi:ubiquinone/menaquinone biosynthesis C-methylase UbiE
MIPVRLLIPGKRSFPVRGAGDDGYNVRPTMSFDVLAPHYRWMEFFLAGEKLQRCRTAFLGKIPTPRNILLLGEGHGRCLLECCRRFGDARITCIDSSAGMLVEARRLLTSHNLSSSRVQLIQTDILNWTPLGNAYDLVVTNFFLDCFTAAQLEEIIRKVAGVTAAEANWLLADFQVAPGRMRRIRSRIILWLMYSFFRLSTQLGAQKLTSPNSFLHCAGFTLRCSTQSEWGLLHSDWWQRKA